MNYELTHLRTLESEAIYVIREVAAERERPVLLFSGGKDSIVLLHLAHKAFRPASIPFPVMHVDTGHNFPEVIEFRDRRVAELGVELIVASVQESIDRGRVVEETGPHASRNRLQTVTLLDAIAERGFDAAFGGARRDEERARAKERIMSFRDEDGQWDPKAQRPELWNLYNGFVKPGEVPFTARVRYRTVGDMTITGAVRSDAADPEAVIAETAVTRLTERGATRADDRTSEAAMEDRKREGYF